MHWFQLPQLSPPPFCLRWPWEPISNDSPELKFIDTKYSKESVTNPWPRNSMSWSLPLKLWKLFYAINFGWREDSSLASGGDHQCVTSPSYNPLRLAKHAAIDIQSARQQKRPHHMSFFYLWVLINGFVTKTDPISHVSGSMYTHLRDIFVVSALKAPSKRWKGTLVATIYIC